MNRAAQRIAGVAAVTVAAVSALAGCTSGTTSVAGGPPAGSSTAPVAVTSAVAPTISLGAAPRSTASTTPPGGATPAPTAGAPTAAPGPVTASGSAQGHVAGLGDCTGGQIRQSTGPLGVGMGHAGEALVFTNISGTACTLTGYPGAEVSKAGGQWDASRVMFGYLGGATGLSSPPLVTLAPGAAASALLMWTDVDDPKAPCRTANFTRLLTTTPNTTSTVSYSPPNGDFTCENLQVTPVVPGTSGRTQQ